MTASVQNAARMRAGAPHERTSMSNNRIRSHSATRMAAALTMMNNHRAIV